MSTIKSRMDKVIQELVNEEDALKIGDANLEFEGQSVSNTNKDNDIQVQLLQEVR